MTNLIIRCPQCEGKPHRYYNESKKRLISSKPKLPTFVNVTYRDAYCMTCHGNGIMAKNSVMKPKLHFTTHLLQESRDAVVTPDGEISTEEYLAI